MSWPYSNNNNSGNLYLSQSTVYVNSGQSASDYISGGSGNYYISSNSNSGIASASISGNTINVYGYSSGNTNVIICSNSSNNACVALYVTVNGNNSYYNYNNTSPVSLSQSNVSVGVGQNASVNISGGTGLYYISSNTNQYLATVTVNGNYVTIYGRQIGSEDVTICSSVQQSGSNNGNGFVYNSCANLNINVGSNYSYNYIPPTSYLNPGTYTSGVFLSQIPYTGASANSSVALFVIGLWIWSATVAYFIVKKYSLLQTYNSSGSASFHDRIEKFKKQNLAFKKRNIN